MTGRITDGPELRLGAPERMAAKARSLALLLASLSPEEEPAASYIDLLGAGEPRPRAAVITLISESRVEPLRGDNTQAVHEIVLDTRWTRL